MVDFTAVFAFIQAHYADVVATAVALERVFARAKGKDVRPYVNAARAAVAAFVAPLPSTPSPAPAPVPVSVPGTPATILIPGPAVDPPAPTPTQVPPAA